MKELKTIAVVGAAGKMGREVCEKLCDDYHIIKVLEDDSLENYESTKLDLIIDFSTASQSVISSLFCQKHHIPLILGVTGQNAEQLNVINDAARHTQIIFSSNFSIGIEILKKFISNLKDYLGGQHCDITIIEKHHIQKVDSPSGTALALKDEIQKSFDQDSYSLNILSERGGKEIGTHQIDFYFGDELISLSHKAFSRSAFADGVVKCAKNIFDKKEGKIV